MFPLCRAFDVASEKREEKTSKGERKREALMEESGSRARGDGGRERCAITLTGWFPRV